MQLPLSRNKHTGGRWYCRMTSISPETQPIAHDRTAPVPPKRELTVTADTAHDNMASDRGI